MKSQRVGVIARAVGVLGGAAVVVVAGAAGWALGIAPLMLPKHQRTFNDAMGFVFALAALPVLALLIGVGIYAIVDASRKATGSPALRLGFFFAVLAGWSLFGLAEHRDAIALTGVVAVPMVANLGAWWAFRRARRRATADPPQV